MVAEIVANTGKTRAASLPRTISASDRSVTSTCVRLPRARSRQTAPAVAAGAARSTRPTCTVASNWKNDDPNSDSSAIDPTHVS